MQYLCNRTSVGLPMRIFEFVGSKFIFLKPIQNPSVFGSVSKMMLPIRSDGHPSENWAAYAALWWNEGTEAKRVIKFWFQFVFNRLILISISFFWVFANASIVHRKFHIDPYLIKINKKPFMKKKLKKIHRIHSLIFFIGFFFCTFAALFRFFFKNFSSLSEYFFFKLESIIAVLMTKR